MKIYNQGSNNFYFLCYGKPKAISTAGKPTFSYSEALHMNFVVSDVHCQFNKKWPFLLLDLRLHILKKSSHILVLWFVCNVKLPSFKSRVHLFLCLGKYLLKSEYSKLIELQRGRGNTHKEHNGRHSAFFVIHFEEFILSSHIITQLSCSGRDRNQENFCCNDWYNHCYVTDPLIGL